MQTQTQGSFIPPNEWNPSMLNGPTFQQNSNGLWQPFQGGVIRLDAAESVWFQRALEFIDTQNYEHLEPANLARTYVPTQPGVPEWALTYTWRMFQKFGEAKIIGNASTDLPRADADGAEQSKVVKLIGAAYGWDFREIKASAKTGTRLDEMKSMGAQFAIA